MEKGLVSIITPVYDSERYLVDTIESVMNQTYVNWELILVDDQSTDESLKIAKEYAEKDARIRLFTKEKNEGVAATRNYGIKIAKGQYIAFLDSDDLWKKNKLDKQISFMEEHRVAFCYSGCEVINQNGESTGKIRKVPTQITYKELLKGNEIPCLTVVLNREMIPCEIRMPQMGHEDYALWLDILKSGVVAQGIHEPLALYRESANSLSGNKWKAAKWNWVILRKHENLSLAHAGICMFSYFVRAMRKRM